jgi:hypothetical protein
MLLTDKYGVFDFFGISLFFFLESRNIIIVNMTTPGWYKHFKRYLGS